MRTDLSSAAIVEKNKLQSSAAWCYLVTVGTTPVQRFTNNNENITSNGNVFTRYPMRVDGVQQDAKGNLPQVVLKVANAENLLTDDLVDNDGLMGFQVTLQCIFTNAPNDVVIEEVFEIVDAEEEEGWISFTLGAESPMLKRFPPDLYMRSNCRHKVYRGTHCQYNGPLNGQMCRRTWDDCVARDNTKRFGGQPGIPYSQ